MRKKILRNLKLITNLKEYYIILLLFLISFLLRIIFMNNGLFHHDSVQLARSTEETLNTLILQPTVNIRYGFVLITSIFHAIPYYILNIESAEFTVAFVTILFSSLSVCLIYIVTRHLVKSRYAAFTTALLFTLNPLFLSITTYAKSHGPAIFFNMLALYLLMQAVRSRSDYSILWFSAAFAFSLLVRFDNILFIVPLIVLYIFPGKILHNKKKILSIKQRFSIRRIFLSIIPFILLLLISLKTRLFHIAGSDTLPFYYIIPYIKHLFASLTLLSQSITIPLIIFIIATTAFIIYRQKSNIYSLSFLFLWFFSIFLPLGTVKVASPRLYIFSIVPLMMIASLGLNLIYKKNPSISISVLFFLCLISFMSIYPIISFRHDYCGTKEYALFTNIHTPNNAVIIANDNSVFIQYYADRSTISYPAYGTDKELLSKIQQVQSLLDSDIPVYVPSNILNLEGRKPLHVLTTYFNLAYVANVTTEDYHHAELKLKTKTRQLFQITKK